MMVVPVNLARVGGRMGGCLVLLMINLVLIMISTGRTGQSCPGGWPNVRMFSIANYSFVFNYY